MRMVIPDLKEFEERCFLFGTKKMKNKLNVFSRFQRSHPLTSTITNLVSISTIQPVSNRNSMRNYFAWLADFFLKNISYLSKGLQRNYFAWLINFFLKKISPLSNSLQRVTSPFLEDTFMMRSFVKSWRLPSRSLFSNECCTVLIVSFCMN